MDYFRAFYQPLVSLQSGRVVAVEALARWIHPVRGTISPIEFIETAEETGLILVIGELIFRTACQDLMKWKKAGLSDFRLAVNFSAKQFQHSNLPRLIKTVLSETGVSPGDLEIEITESAAMLNIEFSIGLMKELSEMGIQISIDDFGTGYSSLSYLKRFPIKTLKIDRSFLHNVPDDPDNCSIIRTIIAMAGNLKLNVIAEGVENQKQLDFLKNNGCETAQGYFFSEPLLPGDLEKFVRKRNIL